MMAVVAGVVLLGTTVTAKATSLIRATDVSVNQQEDNALVLKHANVIFGSEQFALNQHSSHRSHSSHSSHSSHRSHSSHYSSS